MQLTLSESVYEYIVCSKCHLTLDHSNQSQFYLTSCTHSLCAGCLWPSPSSPPVDPHAVEVVCPTCSFEGRIIKLDGRLPEGISHCFKPSRQLLDDLGIALEFQMGNLKEQVAWLKEKVVKQRAVLNKIKDELQRSREVKTLVHCDS